MRTKFYCQLVCGLIGLSILLYTDGIMAQSNLQILRVPPTGFNPGHPTYTYVKYPYILSQTSSSSGPDYFYFPVTLPNGSIIKQIELTCYDDDPTGKIKLSLVAVDGYPPNILGSIESTDSSYEQNIKSAEFTHEIDYTKYSYTLSLEFSSHTKTFNVTSAVIYYLPPSSQSYLPQITK